MPVPVSSSVEGERVGIPLDAPGAGPRSEVSGSSTLKGDRHAHPSCQVGSGSRPSPLSTVTVVSLTALALVPGT